MIQDKVLLEILRNRFQAIADEMALVLVRTAHTVFVKETQDYATALVTTKGEIFAAPRRYGVLVMIGTPMDDAIKAIGDDIQEGDVFITNDPFSTGGMATHLPDLYLWKPVFYHGQVVCYTWSFIHSSDVGGRVPGSIAPSNYEIYQEGLRIPPTKLYRAGNLDESFLNIVLANCRIPDQNWGDLKACLGALNTGERRLHTLLDQFGAEDVGDGIDSLLDYAELQARRVIQRVPDGIYTYVDYLEGDHLGLGMIRIRLDLHVRGDEFFLDYSGTDPQVRASLNLYSYSKTGHGTIIVGLIHWLCTTEPEIAYNAGMVRPFKVHIPPGTLLNAQSPVACGNRSATQVRMTCVNLGALAQALPDEVPAFGPGQASILLVSTPDVETGSTKVSVIQPLIGGSGGRPAEDGVDGVDTIWSFLKNVPTESIENDMPALLITHYGLRPDSGGPGKYRGGMGIEIEFMTTSPYTMVTARAMERYIFQPPGRLGGLPGSTGYTTLNPRTPDEQDLGKIDVLELSQGDTLRIGTQGGGGFGNPLERPVEAVLEDVRKGLVSVASARDAYGVVLDGEGEVDCTATERKRRERLAGGPETPLFTFGPARDDYRRRWPIELEDAVAVAVVGHSPLLRQFLHQQLKTAISERYNAGNPVMPEGVGVILAGVESRLNVGYPHPQEGGA